MDTSNNSVYSSMIFMHIYTKCAKKSKKVLTNEKWCDIILKLSHERNLE